MNQENAATGHGFYERIVTRLKEREKELLCLYAVEELLRDEKLTIEQAIKNLLTIIPSGWQYRSILEVRIIFEGKVYRTDDFKESPWVQRADIVLDQNVVGRIDVYYTQLIDETKPCPFLPEEQKLLDSIAERLSNFIFSKRLRITLEKLKSIPEIKRPPEKDEAILSPDSDIHWKWRYKMAEMIAEKMDLHMYGVKGIYLIGSTKNANAGPASDIDLLIHFQGDKNQLCCLKSWLDGWSYCLAEISFIRSGYKPDAGLIDYHIITDEDIKKKSSFAAMIGSIENSARPLKLQPEPKPTK